MQLTITKERNRTTILILSPFRSCSGPSQSTGSLRGLYIFVETIRQAKFPDGSVGSRSFQQPPFSNPTPKTTPPLADKQHQTIRLPLLSNTFSHPAKRVPIREDLKDHGPVSLKSRRPMRIVHGARLPTRGNIKIVLPAPLSPQLHTPPFRFLRPPHNTQTLTRTSRHKIPPAGESLA